MPTVQGQLEKKTPMPAMISGSSRTADIEKNPGTGRSWADEVSDDPGEKHLVSFLHSRFNADTNFPPPFFSHR